MSDLGIIVKVNGDILSVKHDDHSFLLVNVDVRNFVGHLRQRFQRDGEVTSADGRGDASDSPARTGPRHSGHAQAT